MTGMLSKLDRAQFLRGNFRGNQSRTRPPWALGEEKFLDTCSRCDDCARACPEGIIVRGSGGFPEISFARGECTFCEACVAACAPGALALVTADTPPVRRSPWNIHATISTACLSASGVTCRVCGEYCEAGAIRFALAVGGVAVPRIDADLCTGCGACVAPCPVVAVEVTKGNTAS